MLKTAIFVGLALSSTLFASDLRNRDVRLAASDLELRIMALANVAAHVRDNTATERVCDNAKMEVWNFKQIAGIYDRAQLGGELRGVSAKLGELRRSFDQERLSSDKSLSDALGNVNGAWQALEARLSGGGTDDVLPPPHH